MAQGSYNIGNEEVKEESSWRYPMILFFATLVLCVVFLYHYVGPDVEEIQGNKPRPTINDELIAITIGKQTFNVPANYTVFPRDRRPGEREVLALYASWPRMDGYVPARRNDFVENEADARRLDILIQQKKTPFDELERLEVLYRPHLLDREGTPYDHGLTQFSFRQGSELAPASGYSDKELFLGETAAEETAVIFCYPADADRVVPPECFREYDLTPTVTVKYYFKRPYLAEWRRIDEEVHTLIDNFQAK
ncbi:hypothetical protein [Parvularcula sp. LCG005]|uniref:hypothetical protein n=1 Tax=Parvularcula sp. LCG005 TaxID=3078805 RepID=UPI002943F876|nr:hypothetical protein [Parvularcula sp. LCG005]WOI54606.1 hypothetical protein RUI03_06305 [Parvularcula sp. LCG005]